jgi:hypothetical protein
VVSIAGVWLGTALARLGRQQRRPIDLATVLQEVAERAGVRCAVDNDLVFVTLLMLHGESAPQTAIRAFYQQGMERLSSVRPAAGGEADDRARADAQLRGSAPDV